MMSTAVYPEAPTRRIFSGVQPTGTLTLGNYLGAIRNWVKLQDSYECIYCIVDQHALTIDPDTETLADKTRAVAAALIACGVDPQRHILFNQSLNPDHAELSWYFTCVSRLGWLNRMTQFKDKVGKNREAASSGLFIYPNLMAADILAYRATHVPVGDDQKQHLELARDIAQKFNHDWQAPDFFPLIEPLVLGEATRVMSLRDGTRKMSKSDPSDLSRINLTDPPELIEMKIRKAKTDPDALPETLAELAGRPEALNLLTIYAALCEQSMEQTINEFSGKTFSYFKPRLSDLTIAVIAPISAELKRLLTDKDSIDQNLRQGAERARELSQPVLQATRTLLGLFQ